MCLITFQWQPSADNKLILSANRDEFLHRPALELHPWEDADGVYAGKDLSLGGTWLGVHKNGRFAGAIGIQFDQQKLVRIFNTEAIKQPYPASFIAIYENQADIKDINLFHFYYQGSLTKKDVSTLKKNTKLFAWEYIYE